MASQLLASLSLIIIFAFVGFVGYILSIQIRHRFAILDARNQFATKSYGWHHAKVKLSRVIAQKILMNRSIKSLHKANKLIPTKKVVEQDSYVGKKKLNTVSSDVRIFSKSKSKNKTEISIFLDKNFFSLMMLFFKIFFIFFSTLVESLSQIFESQDI